PAGPMNAYACAMRPLPRARVRRRCARGWSASASSATQKLLDHAADLRTHRHRRPRGVDHAHALGLRALDLEIAASDPAVERKPFALEVIEPPTPDAAEAFGRIEIEE